MHRGREANAAWSTFWARMDACFRLLSCITYEILVCICLTLPTVLASPHHLLRCNLASFWAVFLSPLARQIPLRSLCSLLSFSLVHSLTLVFSYMLSYCLAQFCFSLSPISWTFFSSAHSHVAAKPPSTFSLSVLAPRGKWRYVNCFLLGRCLACYLSILMNSFPPFFP